MSDIVETKQEEEQVESQNDRAWNTLDQEIEIVDAEDVDDEEENEESDVSIEELKERLARYESEEGKSETQTNEQLAGALDELGNVLKGLKTGETPTQSQKQQVQESLQDIKKRLSDKYYDAPLETVDEYVQALLKQQLGPVLGQFARKLNETTKGFTRSQVEQKDTGRFVLENYGDEVENLVKTQNLDYQQAVSRVSADHIDEIVEYKVKKALEKTKAEEEDLPKAKNQNPARSPGARPKEGPQRIVIPRKVRNQLEEEADRKGIDLDRYIRYLRDNDPDRLKGGK